MIDLSKEEFHQWLHSAATQKVFAHLRAERDEIRDATGYGHTLSPKAEETQLLTAKNVGWVQALEFVLNLSIPDEETDE
jgi:hypothetical protein